MKKIVLLFVFSTVMFSIVNGQSVTISPGETSIENEGIYDIPINLKGNESNGIYGGRFNGSLNNPSVPMAGDVLFKISAGGWYGSAYDFTNVRMCFFATEDWNETNSGTMIKFSTSPNGSFIPIDRLIINQNGNIGIGENIEPNAKLEVDGFTKLGLNAPKIKTLKLTGTTASIQGTYATPVPHGLDMDKILDIEVIIKSASNYRQVRGWQATAGYEFDFYFDTNNVQVYNLPNNSGNILNKAFTVFITYEE